MDISHIASLQLYARVYVMHLCDALNRLCDAFFVFFFIFREIGLAVILSSAATLPLIFLDRKNRNGFSCED